MQVETGRLRVVSPETLEPRPRGKKAARAKGAPESSSPGAYIREQRQRVGMSVEQLAAATKIPRSSLTLLEEDRYAELPGPVFVKGFLRCAARALGLGPDAVMELLYAREREALQAKRLQRASEAPADPVVRAIPPRVGRSRSPSHISPVFARMLARLPSFSLALWIAVIVFVGMMVLAAFNLMGAHISAQT